MYFVSDIHIIFGLYGVVDVCLSRIADIVSSFFYRQENDWLSLGFYTESVLRNGYIHYDVVVRFVYG